MRELKLKFGMYGFNPKETLALEGANLHIKLPAGVPNVTQTAIYSKFVLSGECDASCTYELLNFPVKTGYGSMVGMAFDAPQEGAWGGIERVTRPRTGDCYFVMTMLPGADGKMKTQTGLFPTKVVKGKLGLRREGSDLIFMAADSPTAELAEVHRFPFSDETIRSVRFFGDPGGSPTALEARLGNLSIRAEEMTAGITKMEPQGFPWGWLVVGGAIALAILLVWRFGPGRKTSG